MARVPSEPRRPPAGSLRRFRSRAWAV